MKKFLFTLVAVFTISVSADAMSYEQARNQALFLTDKMAYELNLTEEQYEAAYEINLDYLMSITSADDLFGAYWAQRNLDLSYILLDWQFRTYTSAAYFYRPLWWDAGYWHFGIYARYPQRNYFYFGMPRFYAVYRGGHSWRMNGGRSWYNGRNLYGSRGNGNSFGMRDRFQRGDYRDGFNTLSQNPQDNRRRSFGNQQNRNFGGSRNFGNINAPRRSSTRTTVNQGTGNFGFNSPESGRFGGSRSVGNGNFRQTPSRSFSPSRGNRSFGTQNRSFGGGTRSVGGNNNRSTFGGHR